MSRNRFGSRRFIRQDLRTDSSASSSACVPEDSNKVSQIFKKSRVYYKPRQREFRLEFWSEWRTLHEPVSQEATPKIEEK